MKVKITVQGIKTIRWKAIVEIEEEEGGEDIYEVAGEMARTRQVPLIFDENTEDISVIGYLRSDLHEAWRSKAK